ncbi:MAG TPA: hypothetical protein ENH67_05710 [Pseudoalteromonas sp.]|uniref:Glycosyltransferase 2-like domain-containing protein n=1 Tax=marine sediment metagenome TaxID=412755 RepID=A0A0F9RXH0_9ZZZZ|nr:hypothetical protein [Pseudoalteromonas sp.]HDY92147.1 hypothetical protein [Pseudoalteromonas sp.]HDZ32366.1 hypothetical protein [Pseudoalteromonas sp.]
MSNLIVSLTSYGERINSVHHVVESLKNQTCRVDKIILWLDETELSHTQLPKELLNLEDELFEVQFCPNYKSYKKLVPTLLAYPNTNVITFDDDIVIPLGTIEALVEAHIRHPGTIIATRGRLMSANSEGEFDSYDTWSLINNSSEVFANYCILPVGYGGVFYPSGSLSSEVCNVAEFTARADNADDIWFKCMSLLNHTPTLILPRDVSKNYKVIEDSQETALYLTVNTQDRNRDCLYAVAECYPALRELFSIPTFNQVSISSELLKELLAKPDLFENKESGASFFRDSAIKVEKVNMHLALQLMKLARKYRPRGPLIIKKIKEYQAKIKNS